MDESNDSGLEDDDNLKGQYGSHSGHLTIELMICDQINVLRNVIFLYWYLKSRNQWTIIYILLLFIFIVELLREARVLQNKAEAELKKCKGKGI